jgi:hypothetical protein
VSAGRWRAARSSLILPAILGLTSLPGCAETYDASRIGVPIIMGTAAGQNTQGTPFSVTSRAVYAFWGAAKLKDPSIRKAIAAELAGGSSVTNVKVKVRSRWNDVLITVLTLGLIVPRAVTFEGVVQK